MARPIGSIDPIPSHRQASRCPEPAVRSLADEGDAARKRDGDAGSMEAHIPAMGRADGSNLKEEDVR
jgi:hypothetical protein